MNKLLISLMTGLFVISASVFAADMTPAAPTAPADLVVPAAAAEKPAAPPAKAMKKMHQHKKAAAEAAIPAATPAPADK